MSRGTAISCVLLATLSGVVGWQLGRLPVLAELADLRTTYAETARLRSQSAANTLQQAQQRGDVLTDALSLSQVQIDKISREKRDAINRLTTGRVCFSGAAVRMLNDDPADYGSPAVPPATSGPDAADAAAATDTDIGHWIVTAKSQYELCRERYHTLIDWHNTTGAANGNGAD